MFKILCYHDWYTFNALTDAAIKAEIINKKRKRKMYASGLIYVEKICLKCKKYINEIEKRHDYWVSEINKNKDHNEKRKEKAELLRSEIKKGV